MQGKIQILIYADVSGHAKFSNWEILTRDPFLFASRLYFQDT